MHIAIYPFAIGVFVLVAIITSRLTQKFNARNPQLEWVLAAWAVNIISYLVITEFLHFSIVTAGVVYLILSTFTYVYFIGVRWKPIALLNIPSAVALLAFLALFGLLPNQSEVKHVKKVTKEICKCNNMLCVRITSGLLPRDFATNKKWAKQSKTLKQCTQYLEGTQAIAKSTSHNQFFFEESAKDSITPRPKVIAKKIRKSEVTSLVTDEPSDKPELIEITEKRYVNIFVKDLPKHLGKRIKVTKNSGKIIEAELVSVNDKTLQVKSKLSGGFFVMPIQISHLGNIETLKEFKQQVLKK